MVIDLSFDLMVIGMAVGFFVLTERHKSWLAPAVCRWVNPPGFDARLRAILRCEDTAKPDALSWIAVVAIPVLAIAGTVVSATTLAMAGADLLVMGQAIAVALALNQIVKLAVGRGRPFIALLTPEQLARAAESRDHHLSFYSGHTTMAFAMTAAAGTVFHLRGYPIEPLAWSIGLLLAALTGYLRIAADRHYFSDVAIGALSGALVGTLLPLLLH